MSAADFDSTPHDPKSSGSGHRAETLRSLENSRLIEAERATVGHEIHDTLLPLLFGASAGLHNLIQQPGGDQSDASVDAAAHLRREQLKKIAHWIDQALETGRRILGSAYPAELAHRNWADAAADTLQRILDEATQRRTSVQWDVSDAAKILSEPIATAAYRIVIEAVRNACRHGKATEVRVAARVQEDKLSLVVEDNGIGFDPQHVAPDRFGIRSMSGRAHLVGGQLLLSSQPSGPTTVTFRCPIDSPAADSSTADSSTAGEEAF